MNWRLSALPATRFFSVAGIVFPICTQSSNCAKAPVRRLGFLDAAELGHQLLGFDQQTNRHRILGHHRASFRLRGLRQLFFAFFSAFRADFTTLIRCAVTSQPSAVSQFRNLLGQLVPGWPSEHALMAAVLLPLGI